MIRVALSVRKSSDPQFERQIDGIGIYTRELRNRLDGMRNVEVLPVIGFGRRAKRLARRLGHHALPLPYPVSGAISMLTHLPFAGQRALARSADLFHATDYWVPKLTTMPVVATLHDAIPISNPEWGRPSNRALKNLMIRRAGRWADAVITVSEAMRPIIVEQFGISENRVFVVHNGVGAEWSAPVPAPDVAGVLFRRGLPPGFFLTVGTLQPRKNIGRIIAAHRALPESVRKKHPLVIVGAAGWGMEALLPEIRTGEATGDIRWFVDVDDDELRSFYRSAVALVFPSLYEGFGMPMVEAFASGTPVIASNVFAMPEIAGNAALLVDPLAVDQIADAMEGIATDSAQASRLSAAGRQRAAAFSWESNARAVVEIYKSVL